MSKEEMLQMLGKLSPEELIAVLEAVAQYVEREKEFCAIVADREAARYSQLVGRSPAPIIQMAQAEAARGVAWAIRERGAGK